MKEFVVSVLSFLGFGINGVMKPNTYIFANRLASYCKGFIVEELDNGDDYVEFKFTKGRENFILHYVFDKDSKRIIKLEVK